MFWPVSFCGGAGHRVQTLPEIRTLAGFVVSPRWGFGGEVIFFYKNVAPLELDRWRLVFWPVTFLWRERGALAHPSS